MAVGMSAYWPESCCNWRIAFCVSEALLIGYPPDRHRPMTEGVRFSQNRQYTSTSSVEAALRPADRREQQ
jgi:hypothetical protein